MKALIHDGILQYIDKGTVTILKPKTVKWVDVIVQAKPGFDSFLQYLEKVITTNEDDVTISYKVINKDFDALVSKNIRGIRACAIDYVGVHYDSLTLDQLNSFGTFGNEAQVAEARKVYDWKNDITHECLLRINKAVTLNEIQSLDYTEFDATNPNVTIADILTL
jgi:hypothetical protein